MLLTALPVYGSFESMWRIVEGYLTRFGKWCRKIIDPEPEPTENELLEFLPGFRELFAADLC